MISRIFLTFLCNTWFDLRFGLPTSETFSCLVTKKLRKTQDQWSLESFVRLDKIYRPLRCSWRFVLLLHYGMMLLLSFRLRCPFTENDMPFNCKRHVVCDVFDWEGDWRNGETICSGKIFTLSFIISFYRSLLLSFELKSDRSLEFE